MKDIIGMILVVALLIGIPITVSFTLGTRNIDKVKAVAPQVFKDWGFEIAGCEGYQHDVLYGGRVWYMVKRPSQWDHQKEDQTDEDPTVIYTACIYKWGDEIHLSQMRALNALKGN